MSAIPTSLAVFARRTKAAAQLGFSSAGQQRSPFQYNEIPAARDDQLASGVERDRADALVIENAGFTRCS